MGRYCPKCYVGVSNTDAICGNCNAELSIEPSVTEELNPSEEIIEEIEVEEVSESNEGIETISVAEEGPDKEESISDAVSGVIGSVYEEPSTPFTEKKTEPMKHDNSEKTMSFGDWMLTLLLTYIPIVNIIMLIVWSVDAKTNTNKKHFAWAQLVFMAIGVVVSIIFSTLIVGMILSLVGNGYYY